KKSSLRFLRSELQTFSGCRSRIASGTSFHRHDGNTIDGIFNELYLGDLMFLSTNYIPKSLMALPPRIFSLSSSDTPSISLIILTVPWVHVADGSPWG